MARPIMKRRERVRVEFGLSISCSNCSMAKINRAMELTDACSKVVAAVEDFSASVA
jgi:hypothetical protein